VTPHSRLWVKKHLRGIPEDLNKIVAPKDSNHESHVPFSHEDCKWIDVHRVASARGRDDDAEGASLVVFVGEAMEAATDGYFCAVEHNVRVDPSDETWLSRSNEGRDPAAVSHGNRLSVAMVIDC